MCALCFIVLLFSLCILCRHCIISGAKSSNQILQCCFVVVNKTTGIIIEFETAWGFTTFLLPLRSRSVDRRLINYVKKQKIRGKAEKSCIAGNCYNQQILTWLCNCNGFCFRWLPKITRCSWNIFLNFLCSTKDDRSFLTFLLSWFIKTQSWRTKVWDCLWSRGEIVHVFHDKFESLHALHFNQQFSWNLTNSFGNFWSVNCRSLQWKSLKNFLFFKNFTDFEIKNFTSMENFPLIVTVRNEKEATWATKRNTNNKVISVTI